jgi:hypothetical protein
MNRRLSVISSKNVAQCLVASIVGLLGLSFASAHEPTTDYAKAEMDPGAGYRVTERSQGSPNRRGFLVTIHFDGNRWQPDNVIHDSAMMQRAPGQEILYVSEDKKFWRLAVPSDMVNCPKAARAADAQYTVCNSAFGHLSSIGAIASVMVSLGTSMLDAKPVVLDEKLLKQAVLSVPETALSELLADDAQRQMQDRQLQMAAQATIAADQASVRMAEQRAEADRMVAVQGNLQQQPQSTTLFCQTDDKWPRATGDSLDRQRLVCHLAGQPNLGPIMGSWLISNGWTIQSEMRRMDPYIIVVQLGTVEVTTATLRKTG